MFCPVITALFTILCSLFAFPFYHNLHFYHRLTSTKDQPYSASHGTEGAKYVAQRLAAKRRFCVAQRSKNEPQAEHRSVSEERSVLAARYATRRFAHGHGRPGAVSPLFISSVFLYGIIF